MQWLIVIIVAIVIFMYLNRKCRERYIPPSLGTPYSPDLYPLFSGPYGFIPPTVSVDPAVVQHNDEIWPYQFRPRVGAGTFGFPDY